MWDIFGNPLKAAIWNTPSVLAVQTTCVRFSSVLDDACVVSRLFLSTGSCHVFIKIHATAIASPDATQKPLTLKTARSGDVKWVQVSRDEPGRKAKRPRTSRSQPSACSHKEHAILTTAEATAFAAQVWDRRTQPYKASQHEFLATCNDVDVEKNVKYSNYEKYTIKRGHRTNYFVPCSAVFVCTVPCVVLR